MGADALGFVAQPSFSTRSLGQVTEGWTMRSSSRASTMFCFCSALLRVSSSSVVLVPVLVAVADGGANPCR
jgi:hypothetical protein